MCILCTHNVYSMYTQCVFYVHTMCILCTHNVYSMYTQCVFYVHTMCILCTHNVYSMHTQWCRYINIKIKLLNNKFIINLTGGITLQKSGIFVNSKLSKLSSYR